MTDLTSQKILQQISCLSTKFDLLRAAAEHRWGRHGRPKEPQDIRISRAYATIKKLRAENLKLHKLLAKQL